MTDVKEKRGVSYVEALESHRRLQEAHRAIEKLYEHENDRADNIVMDAHAYRAEGIKMALDALDGRYDDKASSTKDRTDIDTGEAPAGSRMSAKEDLCALHAIFAKFNSSGRDLSRFVPVVLEDNTMNGIDTVKTKWRVQFWDQRESEFYIQAEKRGDAYETSIWVWDDAHDPELIEIDINDVGVF